MMIIVTDNIANADNVDNDINDENGDNCDTAGHGDIAENDDNDDIRIPKLDTDNNISKAKPTKLARTPQSPCEPGWCYSSQGEYTDHLCSREPSDQRVPPPCTSQTGALPV